ncbi:non-ribosomal peptide synthetase [Streptomyces sp. JV184]|uniref:non-ribosomal peptide synthetase n=1 Tax=Streptomyces sp. JV184 TaxID=858637 RepID=UPI002E7667F0|nr:non-ribosomal peptide synthetase [Streptomyces sp. JV184]MEE1745563.1 amino acid adenylation domain-containing protein [Streptomyces sp. JV184]
MNRAPRQDTADTARPELPPVLVPTDRPRGTGTPPRCSAVARTELAAGTAPVGTARDDVLFAGFAALLYRFTGQERIGVDRMDRAGRTEHVLLTVTGGATLRDVAHGAELGHAPGAAPVGMRFAPPGESSPDTTVPMELQLVLYPATHGRSTLELHYDGALFDRSTAERMLAHYRTLIDDATRSPDRPVELLRLLTVAQRRRILVEWNRTAADLPHNTCLHHAFEARAEQSPDAVAVVHGTERWTYGRVDAEANRLAHHLRSLGVGPDVRVGLCLDRSPGLLVAVLGILKAGGAYVPLDPDYPAQRITAMAEGTSCAVTVSREALAAHLPDGGTGAHLVLLDRDADLLAARPSHALGTTAGPDQLCYVIHTSGSTGTPKPIALRHRGVMNNLADLNTRFGVGPGDSVLALSSPSFDMSVYEFLGMTLAGGTVVVPEQGRAKDPMHWAELLAAHGVTVWNSAPALLGLLTDHLEQSGARRLPRLRLAMLGGDWVPVRLPDRVRALAPGLRFIVMGGATEASIHSTIYEVGTVDPGWSSIPYGRPMANQRTYILDEARQPVPPGVPGELYLAGTGLARGYLDQPERTAERFVDWSHGEVTERLYRTGDLARFGADGLIELLGRMDFQVKVNGLRVELGEIETVLRGHPAIRQVSVVAREGRLIAYAVPVGPGGDPDTSDAHDAAAVSDELRALAADRLPEYMVPRAFVTLDALPLTPNGKVDRANLPEPVFTGADHREPGTATERVLAEVFADVLGRGLVGVDDDFLAVGGDSVRAIQVVTRARARGFEITARQLLERRTVAALAGVAAATDPAAAGDENAFAPLVTVDPADIEAWRRRHPRLSDVWPLTAMQSGMLFESMLNDTGHDTYQIQTVFHLSGPVDTDRLRAAGQALLDRYANLRVAFVRDSTDNLVQLVVDGVELPWREVVIGDPPEDEREGALRRFLAEDRTERFDPAAPPLLRMALVRLGPDRAELVLTAHHALVDGWSEHVLAHDLQRLYASGGDASVLEPVCGFRDFLAWLARRDTEEGNRAWAAELAGVDGPTLLTPPGALPDPHAGVGEIALPLSRDELRHLSRCCADLGVTVNSLVQGAWAVLLGALTGRTDVVFGATVSGRPGALAGVESMVGLFINTVPVRARWEPGATAAELLTGLRDRQTLLLDHHHHGLTEIHRATGVDALFDTLVVFQSYPTGRTDAGAAPTPAVEVTGVTSVGTVNYPLALFVEPHRLTVQYHRGLYDEEAAKSLTARFRSILHQLAASPGMQVSAVDLLSAAERDWFTGKFDDSTGTVAETLTTLFERRAAAAPDAVAVVCGEQSLTYGDLDTRSERLARLLAGKGVGSESVVALSVPRSTHLAVALLGTLKSGAAYAPAGPDAVPGAALTLTLADIEEAGSTGRREQGAPLGAGHLACLRRTPGITGRLAVGHDTLVQEVRDFVSRAGLVPGARMLAASPGPDAAAFEVLSGLCAGATVDVAADPGAADGHGDWKGAVVSTTAPVLAGVLDRSPGAVDAGAVVLTGDVPSGPLLRYVREGVPGARTAHVGGGRRYVLGPALQPLPAGATGELYVAGPVARGWADDTALTASRFVADPYGPPGSRMYRTGDLARWNREGELEYAGCAGADARVRGRRVRTCDVESVLSAHPGVAQGLVVAHEGAGSGGDDLLVGYVVPRRDGGGAEAAELRAFLARRLPDALVPTAVVILDRLPLTADGAVDRGALPDPGTGSAEGPYREGRTPREKALCAMFAEAIGVERIGIDDNFLALGVNSLMAGKLVGRMHRTLGIKSSIRTVFRYPTIAQLSGRLGTTAAKNRPPLRRMTGNQA